MKPHLRLIAIGFVMTIATCSFAQQLVITQTGTGSGTLNGISFPSTSFTITQYTYDVSYRRDLWTAESVRYGYAIHNSLVSIEIVGVGNFTVTYPGTQSLVNNITGMFAFGRDEYGAQADLFDGPTDDSFLTWDMLTGIGPISGTGNLVQWGEFPRVATSSGDLIFTSSVYDLGAFPTTFTAQVVPEPSTYAAFAGLVALGFVAYRRRRKVG